MDQGGHEESIGTPNMAVGAVVPEDFLLRLIVILGAYQQVNARAVEVIGERCNIYGVKELQFSIPEGPMYQYTPQTKEDFGHQKLTGNLYQNMYN